MAVLALELDGWLRELIGIYERLAALSESRRSAIERAEARRLAGLVAEENALVQRIAEIEKVRMVAASRLAAALGMPDPSRATVRAMAARVPGEAGARLGRSAATLREVAERLKRTNEVVRSAAETLAAHVEGLMRTVQAQLSRATTYGSRGQMAVRRSGAMALDLRH